MKMYVYGTYPNQSGKVYVQILLDKKGKIHVLKTKSTHGISLRFENEIKKILEKMPLQKPIYFHNQLVSSRFTLPILIPSAKNIKYKNYPNTKKHRPYTNN